MTTIKIAIYIREAEFIEDFSLRLSSILRESGIKPDLSSFVNGSLLEEKINAGTHYDLVITDISDEKKGISIAQTLKGQLHQPLVIFLASKANIRYQILKYQMII